MNYGKSEFAVALGERLRVARTRLSLSLGDVERKSRGHWKAVVVGSYERADRAITAERLAALCKFYGVPAGEVLDGQPQVSGPEALRFWLSPLLEMTDAELDDLMQRAQALRTRKAVA